jgi:hypothetical protein
MPLAGYIKLWRASVNTKEYFAEPFTHWQAWVDLLLLANYKENMVYVRGVPVNVKAGQVIAVEDFLADRWKWSRGKVRRFLYQLSSKSVQQIEQQKSNVITVISIVNWEKYQGNCLQDDTADSTTSSTTDGQQIVQQTDTLKNNKNNKNNKKIKKDIERKVFGQFENVFLSDKEYDSLIAKFGQLTPDKIEELSVGIASKGYKLKSHYATILSWDRLNTKRREHGTGKGKVATHYTDIKAWRESRAGPGAGRSMEEVSPGRTEQEALPDVQRKHVVSGPDKPE